MTFLAGVLESTSFGQVLDQDVNGRHKAGHDGVRVISD
jgi:hypothetical protein